MTDNLKPMCGKHRSGGSRKNAGRKPMPASEKPINIDGYVATEIIEGFRKLIPAAADRNKLYTQWMRAYVIAGGETDRLLAQSPLAAELLTHLEVTDAPEELRDRLESLMVQRASDEVKVATGVIKTKNGAYII